MSKYSRQQIFSIGLRQGPQLRRELAAAKDYEQLDAQASKSAPGARTMPLVATSDPLPEAFAATLGRLLPLDGRVGVSSSSRSSSKS